MNAQIRAKPPTILFNICVVENVFFVKDERTVFTTEMILFEYWSWFEQQKPELLVSLFYRCFLWVRCMPHKYTSPRPTRTTTSLSLPSLPQPLSLPLSQKIIRCSASIQLQLIGQTTFSNARSLLGGCDGHQLSAWFLVTRNEPAQGLGLAIPSCSPRA